MIFIFNQQLSSRAGTDKYYRHETFQIFGRFQIFSFQILISKVVGFHLKVTKALFLTGGVGGFRLFMACSRFFHAELSLMPDINKDTGHIKYLKKVSMIRKYHSLTLQTNPWHHEEEPQQNTNSHKTLGRQKFKVKQQAHSSQSR